MYSKTYFIRTLIKESGLISPRILELGCGTSRHIAPILRECSDITYLGVEPYAPSYATAQKELADIPNAHVIHQQGYGAISGVDPASFDIVFSLSVLEHVKQLDKLIALSARYAKPGALVVHRYDLGHALHSRSLKEKFQVWVGNTYPDLLPEDKFVRYVPESEVRSLLTASGCDILKTTYHEMNGQKVLNAALSKGGAMTAAMETLLEWEYTHANAFLDIEKSARERLFPSVAVWSKKR
jgi:SAM-dependent methyltransferase